MTSPLDLSTIFPDETDRSPPLCRVFGVRHLSPAAAHHLETVLDALRPTAVLVEGPSDATDQVKHLVHKDTKPPVALLAYTKTRPVRSILYPLARYSPEWVALTWGLRYKADTRFIDLPAFVFLELHQLTEEKPEHGEGEQPPDDEESQKKRRKATAHTVAYLDDPWEAIAKLAGDPDHETWWERHFEHTPDPASYVRQAFEFGKGLRELRKLSDKDENLIREAFMRRCIREVLAKGHEPDKVLVVCGAFHGPALTEELPPMSDKEVKALPRGESSLTLMPYSYYRLSSQSGYGAGNHAPAYFQRLYEERRLGQKERVAARFLSEVVHEMRRKGNIRSAAEVIEAVRLAQSLAALAGSPAPTLRDLRDAAITCLGRADVSVVRPHLIEIEVGNEVGSLPKGISRTSIQDDFYYHLEALKLSKYQTEKPQELELDLREDRYVKSEEAAFRDRNRSTFLHRLLTLGVGFGTKLKSGQDAATWKEVWRLSWTPECEIQLVESALKGDTVETASAMRLSERLSECANVAQSADLVKDAITCQLADALEDARKRVQAMATDENAFVTLAWAADSLAEAIKYRSVRKFDPEPLRPLLAQMFLRATLQLRQACVCDEAATKGLDEKEESRRIDWARRQGRSAERTDIFKGPEEYGVRRAIVDLNRVAFENAEDVDHQRWHAELDAIAAADNLNPFLSGLAGAIVLEKGRISEEELAKEVSRRLSPGVPADLGAGWFEGLVSYNRMALFSRLGLWRQLDLYIASLDEEAFRTALLFLRRAFGDFDQSEVRRVVSNLVEIASEAGERLKETVEVKLDEDEAKKLQELLGDLSF
jgi:hypothetical protein